MLFDLHFYLSLFSIEGKLHEEGDLMLKKFILFFHADEVYRLQTQNQLNAIYLFHEFHESE